MLPLYGPHIPEVIFILLRCSNRKQPDLYLMTFQDFPVLIIAMLEHLGWDTLEQRRNQLTLLMLYKIIHQLVEVPNQYILTKAPASTRSGTSKFIHLYSRIDSYKFSFFPRAIRLWNSLPNHVTQSASFDIFKPLIM